MLKELKAWWDATFKGAKKAHKVGWVDKGLEAQILSSDLRSMALEGSTPGVESICESFEVPEVLIGGMLERIRQRRGSPPLLHAGSRHPEAGPLRRHDQCRACVGDRPERGVRVRHGRNGDPARRQGREGTATYQPEERRDRRCRLCTRGAGLEA